MDSAIEGKEGNRMDLNDLRECEEMDFVSGNLTERTAYEGLAEECCELAQAALKAIRAADGENPTPVSLEEAKEKIREEAGDVMVYLELLGYLPRGTTKDNPKWKRWAKRIRERGKE